MFQKSLTAVVLLATSILGNATQADFTMDFDPSTGTMEIRSGYIETAEYFDIYTETVNRLTYVVVEDAFGQRERVRVSYNLRQVREIRFYGDNDTDVVLNDTSIPLIAYLGGGDDYAQGGSGDDRLFGEDGDDSLIGKKGRDYLDGGNGFDHVFGNQGNDTMYCGPDVNEGQVVGGLGADIAYVHPYTQNSLVDLGGQNRDELVVVQ